MSRFSPRILSPGVLVAAQASFVAFAVALGVSGCAPIVTPDRATLSPATFDDLPGWRDDDPRAALQALARSCKALARKPAWASIGPRALAGRAGDWHGPCRALVNNDALFGGAEAARHFIEQNFRPWAVVGENGTEGLFTGYYEASLRGARHPSRRYYVPLYRRPPDLVTADLGAFSGKWRGRTIAGQVRKGRLVPYADRTTIEKGALKGRGLELLWVDDPVDAFFLQIQGSGRVQMNDGTVVRVGYDSKNGRAYTSIGGVLIRMGALDRKTVSMQSIRAWLAANPKKAKPVLAKNRSYVFFRELTGEGPIGAAGVPLTADRSLAVDRKFLPLGVPMYIAADDPQAGSGGAHTLAPVRRLMVAQDTGGAIRGAVRGDMFTGWGPDAARRAGLAKMRGRYWMLLPLGVPGAKSAKTAAR